MATKIKFLFTRQGGLTLLCILCMLLFAVAGCKDDHEDNIRPGEELLEWIQANFEHSFTSVGETEVVDQYVFPIQPGTDEWYALEMKERVDASQVPEEVLAKISTAGLLETCLDMPFLIEITFGGVERMASSYNGIRELLNRPDLPGILIEKYLRFSVDVKNVYSLSLLDQGRLSFKTFVLEIIAAQDAVLDNLSSVEQEGTLFLLALEQNQILKNYSDIFGNQHSTTTALLVAKTIIRNNLADAKETEKLITFIQNPSAVEQNVIEEYLEKYFNLKYK